MDPLKTNLAALPKLTGARNYLTWRATLEAYFRAIKIHHVLDPETSLTEEKKLTGNHNKTDDELKASVQDKSNIGAFLLLTQVADDLQHLVANKSFAEGWTAIDNAFQPKTAASVFKLKRELSRFKADDFEPAPMIISRLEALMSRISLADPTSTLSEVDKGIVLISSLPPKYDTMIRLLEINDKLSYTEVKKALLETSSTSRRNDREESFVDLSPSPSEAATFLKSPSEPKSRLVTVKRPRV